MIAGPDSCLLASVEGSHSFAQFPKIEGTEKISVEIETRACVKVEVGRK